MVQCDDDGDGQVIFNLVEGAYLIDDLPLTFYPSMADALAQTNEITNPTAYSHTAGVNSDTTIIVRQEITGDCDTLTQLPIIALPNCAVGNMCNTANSLCSALGVPFANTINIEEAQPFYYACLAQTPNPVWFYIPIGAAGDLHLKIEQNASIDFTGNELDADYIIFGPFTDPVTPCSNGTLMGNNIDSCSNSIEEIEYPTVENVQPGEFYLMMVINYYNMPGYIRVTEMPTSTAEIDCTGIRLTAFLDANANGTMETGEQPFPLGNFGIELNNSGSIQYVQSPLGTHSIYETQATNTYDIGYTIDPEYAAHYSVAAPSLQDIGITTGGGMTDYYFAVSSIQDYTDVAIAIISTGPPMPGFEYLNKIVYSNLGNQAVASGTITFAKDPLLSIVSVSEAGAVLSPDGFTFDYVNLQPFEVREIDVVLQVPTIPTVTLGNSLLSTAGITPLTDDVNQDNNTSRIIEVIVGSYDPNDKMESRGAQILLDDFSQNDYLYYTIRFENTGTAPAINIRVDDIIDESLDIGTLRMVSASHEYTMQRIDAAVSWHFDGILLPYTSADPIGSHGYITFMIKPLAGYDVGDVIPNTASIYFDYNPAIITNTFTTTFVDNLAVDDFEATAVSLWPNPAHSVLYVSDSANAISGLVIYDVSGKEVMRATPSGENATMDVTPLSPGLYFVEVQSNSKKIVRKLLKE